MVIMKKLLLMCLITCSAKPMALKTFLYHTKSSTLLSAGCKLRTFTTHKSSLVAPALRYPSTWKQTYAEYKKALIDREKCKTWKQIGYGMHDGYCSSSRSCQCTHRLVLIAKK
jgi:hypothetical protein